MKHSYNKPQLHRFFLKNTDLCLYTDRPGFRAFFRENPKGECLHPCKFYIVFQELSLVDSDIFQLLATPPPICT